MVSLSLNTLKLQTYEKGFEKQSFFHVTLQPDYCQLVVFLAAFLLFVFLSGISGLQLDYLAFEREAAAPSMLDCMWWSSSPLTGLHWVKEISGKLDLAKGILFKRWQCCTHHPFLLLEISSQLVLHQRTFSRLFRPLFFPLSSLPASVLLFYILIMQLNHTH